MQSFGVMFLRVLFERGNVDEIDKAVDIVSLDVDKYILRQAGNLLRGVNRRVSVETLIGVLKNRSLVDLKVDKESWNRRLDEILMCSMQNGDRESVIVEADRQWKRMQLLRLMELCEKGIRGEESAESVFGKLKKKVNEVDSGLFVRGDDRGDEGILSSVVTRFCERELRKEEKILLGLPTLDMVMGGLNRGTLGVVLAGTSMGKTSFMIYLSGISMLQGYSVLYVTLEDLREVIEERIDRLLFYFDSDAEFSKKLSVLRGVGADIYVRYLSDATVADVSNLVDDFKDKGVSIDVLVIDYGDLLVVDRSRDEFIEIGNVFHNLLQMAINKKLWVISGSQAVRSAMNTKVLGLEHTSRSFRKVEVAHYVFGLMASKDEESKNQVRVSVLKNKFGVKGMAVSCEVDWGRCIFKEV